MGLSKGNFGRPIDGHEEIELSAIVERQKRMFAESYSDGLILKSKTVKRGSLAHGRVVDKGSSSSTWRRFWD
jgi:hypothetical protein